MGGYVAGQLRIEDEYEYIGIVIKFQRLLMSGLAGEGANDFVRC